MHEIMNPGKDRELSPVSDKNHTYTSNECYQLQTCQQKNTATIIIIRNKYKKTITKN